MTRDEFAEMLIEKFAEDLRRNLAAFNYTDIEETECPYVFLAHDGDDVDFAEINRTPLTIVTFNKAIKQERIKR